MSNRVYACIGIIVIALAVVCVGLASVGIVSLGTRAENKALHERHVAIIDARNATINILELKLEFLERNCRWLIFLKQALPADIIAELDVLAEQLRQSKYAE